ncbi:unnamed protein product [Protopolystoma xenopodis]|uniref:Uncharacterized protein n=1 Tax=Protopolystoma xenopodis TaxID=117903 RepID=A0A3S5BD84_9PLAT|nr:unnamed protein product [Protopolystoma xenopodis]
MVSILIAVLYSGDQVLAKLLTCPPQEVAFWLGLEEFDESQEELCYQTKGRYNSKRTRSGDFVQCEDTLSLSAYDVIAFENIFNPKFDGTTLESYQETMNCESEDEYDECLQDETEQ